MRIHNYCFCAAMLGGIAGTLAACSDEWEKWEPVKMEMTASCPAEIPASGGSYSFSLKTNGDWEVTSCPNWIELDRTAGSGDATISFNVKRNTSATSRGGGIAMKVNGSGSVVGDGTPSFYFNQKGLIGGMTLAFADDMYCIQYDTQNAARRFGYKGAATLNMSVDLKGASAEEKQRILDNSTVSVRVSMQCRSKYTSNYQEQMQSRNCDRKELEQLINTGSLKLEWEHESEYMDAAECLNSLHYNPMVHIYVNASIDGMHAEASKSFTFKK